MAENKENEIELIIRVVDSAIKINITRPRSADVVRKSIAFATNAHLAHILGCTPRAFVTSSSILVFEPTVGPETRFCDFTSEDKAITVYILADLGTPTLMARIRELVEKENTQYSSKQLDHSTFPTSPLPSSSSPQLPNDVMFNMIQDLKLKLEGADVQRKKEKEQAEAQRKKEKEQAEAQRKKEKEQAEAQRKKEKEQAEAQRKKDKEQAEAQRKKDKEQAEVQRKKDQAAVTELENRVKSLQQDASELKLEHKQKNEAMQRYIEHLAHDVEATTDFLASGDEAGLDRIKRRNLLDRAQASLAMHLGMTNNHYGASMHFRETLDPLSSDEDRQQRLSQILLDNKHEIPPEAALLITKPATLKLLAERFPKVRLDGDQVAHGYRQRSWYEGSVSRSVGTDHVALTGLLDFAFPVGQ